MDSTSTDRDASLDELARAKLVKVLGLDRGQRVYCETLRELGLSAIDSPDELHEFGEYLSRRGGIEAAVGAMLGVAAVVRGAAGRTRVERERS